MTSFASLCIFLSMTTVLLFLPMHTECKKGDSPNQSESQNASDTSLNVTGPGKSGLHSRNYRSKKDQITQSISQRGKSWQAAVNPEFEELNLTDFRALLGGVDLPKAEPGARETRPTREPPANRKQAPKHGHRQNPHDRNRRQSTLPSTYDARTVYPKCPSIGSIRYQYRCSSCWAVTAASVISDRHCIYNVNKTGQLYFSPMHVISCVAKGCTGGKEWDAYDYWVKNGLVTGGTAYVGAAQPDGCLPYPYGIDSTPTSCPTSCSTSYTKSFDQDKVYGGSWYNWWDPSVEKIKQEIFSYGPVVTFFPCYEDLFYYKSGVYEYTSGALVGYHLTKLIGWGTEGGVDYWLAVNTWGTKWGDLGTFKIRRGVNTVGIEERISSVLPKEAL